VGFNNGDGIHYYEHPLSSTDNILYIYGQSNVGLTGRLVYRVDGNITVSEVSASSKAPTSFQSDSSSTSKGITLLSRTSVGRGHYKMMAGVCLSVCLSVRLSVCHMPLPNSRTERLGSPILPEWKHIKLVTREPL